MSGFAPVELGRERIQKCMMPRHRHDFAYAAVVLSGGYEGAGDRGRWCVRTGDVLIHQPFEAHFDRIDLATEVINMALPAGCLFPNAAGRVADPDRIVRLMEIDPKEALEEFLVQFAPADQPEDEWPDRLARWLAKDGSPISAWAQTNGLHVSSVSRGFHALYGIFAPSIPGGVARAAIVAAPGGPRWRARGGRRRTGFRRSSAYEPRAPEDIRFHSRPVAA